MQRKTAVALLTTALVAAFSATASAVPVTISVETDYRIDSILGGGLFDTAGFILNEKVNLRFTIDNATLDTDGGATSGRYGDALGFYVIIGDTSGATVTTNNGVDLSIDDDRELELRSGDALPDETLGAINIDSDFDFDFADNVLFSDTNVLSTALADLPGDFDFEGPDFASVSLGDGISEVVQAEFSVGEEHSATFALVPEVQSVPTPASLGLLVFGLAGLMVARRRRVVA